MALNAQQKFLCMNKNFLNLEFSDNDSKLKFYLMKLHTSNLDFKCIPSKFESTFLKT